MSVMFARESLPCFSSKMLLLSQHFRLTVVFSLVISPHAPGWAEDIIAHLCSLAVGRSPCSEPPIACPPALALAAGTAGEHISPSSPQLLAWRRQLQSRIDSMCRTSHGMWGPKPGDRQSQAHKVHLTPLPFSANTILGCGTSSLSCFPPGMQDTCFSSYSRTARLNKKQDLAKKVQ